MYLIGMLFFIFAHATPRLPPCAALLQAQPIPHTPQTIYPIELESAGTLVFADQPLPALEMGFYVYLITANGDILFAPKYHLRSAPRSLATHKSLLELYKKAMRDRDTPDIVAAGEFQIAFDEAVEIRNKSGNFRGESESLDLAVEVLTHHGLPITSRTQIAPVVPGRVEDLGHTPQNRDQDSFRLQTMHELHSSVRGTILVDLYRRMYSLLRETFPGRHGLELIQKLVEAQRAGAQLTGNYDGYQTFYYPLQSAFSADGFEYGIWVIERAPDHGGEEGFGRGVVKQIKNFVLGAQKEMAPGLGDKWDRLAQEFAYLERL
jgi:hypothetical protein